MSSYFESSTVFGARRAFYAGKLYRLTVYMLLFRYGRHTAGKGRRTGGQACSGVARHSWATQTEDATARWAERFHFVSDCSHSPIGKGRPGDGVKPCPGRGDASS